MTLQGLSKYLEKYDRQIVDNSSFESLKGLPFYNWQLPITDDSTLNHAIGLPQKNGQEFPLFDYEQLLYS